MSFPWRKKSRSTKISKFVNDHLQHSQKRRDGSTFVVETGFPTSLIDLFIKNRDNLKKPAKKKRVSRNQNKSPIVNVVVNDVVNDVVSDDYNDYSSGINQVILGSPTPYPSPVSSPLVNEEEERFVEKVEKVIEKGVVDSNSDSNGYFLIVLKLFLIVVLALGTKRLTVGITLSAFLLVLLESLGNRASLLLKSCPDVNWVLKLFGNSSRFKEGKLDQESIQENRVEEIVCEENEVMEGIDSEVVLRESRRGKIKSKMNKFVQKKLRNSIKVQNQIFSEEKELEKSGNLSSISSGSCGEEDAINAVFDITPKANEEDIKVKDSGVIWPALVLFLIVLIGLIGGRVFAFLLTLLWFSLLKLSEKLRYR